MLTVGQQNSNPPSPQSRSFKLHLRSVSYGSSSNENLVETMDYSKEPYIKSTGDEWADVTAGVRSCDRRTTKRR